MDEYDWWQKISEALVGTSDSVERAAESVGVPEDFCLDDPEDKLLNHNVECCEGCGRWFESHDLVDDDEESSVCEGCRDSED